MKECDSPIRRHAWYPIMNAATHGRARYTMADR